MTILVTGAAGFIGSHLVEALLAQGRRVVGVDSLDPHYDPALKLRNLEGALRHPGFVFQQLDPLTEFRRWWPDEVESIVHLAGRPGVRDSGGATAGAHVTSNIVLTQRILEIATAIGQPKMVFASSSSVYGENRGHPSKETDPLAPVSAYGLTKLAAEELCHTHARRFGLPLVVLRLFTVFGPRQRPEMAISRFIDAMRAGRPVTVLGDGSQRREFTYVDDVVRAIIGVVDGDVDNGVLNVGGGRSVSVGEVLTLLARIMEQPVEIGHRPEHPDDIGSTRADISRIADLIGWRPSVSLEEGLRLQVTHSGVTTSSVR